jgi:hypothetical protein
MATDPTDAGVDDVVEKQIKAAAAANKKAAEHAKKMEISSKIIADRQDKHLKLEDKLMKQRRLLEVGTRVGGAVGGGMGGAVFGFLQQVASMKMMDYSSKREDLMDKGKKFPLTGSDRLAKDKQESTMLGRLDKTIDRAFGGDSKWNKMFGGHGRMAAMGAGMGAVGGGLALTKAIIDSSAMLQQMLKLLQFGVMLILKPIGDFFGFLMRPILILMLRKFIIPFYQKVYPWFVTQGAKLGDNIVKIFNLLDSPVFYMALAGAFGTAMAAIWKGSKIFTDSIMDKFAQKIGIQVAAKGKIPVVDDVITSATDKTIKKTPAWINEDGSFNKDWQKQQAAIKNALPEEAKNTNKITTVEEDFKKGSSSLDFADQKKKGNVFNQLREKYNKIQNTVNNRKWNPISVKNLANLGKALFKGLPAGMAAEGMGVTDAVLNEAFKLVEGFSKLAGVHVDLPTMGEGKYDPTQVGGIEAANGFNGMINKPTMFLAGEKGSEHVQITPHGQQSGGTTVNISIGNMSGDANDLNKLRSTILEVMQTVNVNRGR